MADKRLDQSRTCLGHISPQKQKKNHTTQKKIRFALCIIFLDNLTTFQSTNLITVKKEKSTAMWKNNKIAKYLFILMVYGCVCVCVLYWLYADLKNTALQKWKWNKELNVQYALQMQICAIVKKIMLQCRKS